MNYLIDTHTFIWFVEGNPRLSTLARAHIEEPANVIYLSIASVWEMAIKVSLRKLSVAQPFDEFIMHQISVNDIMILDIALAHTFVVSHLPLHHRDPFDRIIIAQSIANSLPLIGTDDIFDSYGVQRVW